MAEINGRAGIRMHDYDPTWDYSINGDPSPQDRRLVQTLQQACHRSGLIDALGLPQPRIMVAHMGALEAELAIFCQGTHAAPIVVMDLDSLRGWARARRADVLQTVQEYFASCMIDAWQEASGRDGELEKDQVQAFVETWTMTGAVDRAMIEEWANQAHVAAGPPGP